MARSFELPETVKSRLVFFSGLKIEHAEAIHGHGLGARVYQTRTDRKCEIAHNVHQCLLMCFDQDASGVDNSVSELLNDAFSGSKKTVSEEIFERIQ